MTKAEGSSGLEELGSAQGCPQHESPSPGYEYSDKKSKSKG